jgi:exodeoxyribonuclease-3
MKIASWNVNSLRVRLPHLLDWLVTSRPAMLGLQETKLTDDKFPQKEIESAGYHVVFAGQPTYNGVALLVDAAHFQPPHNVQINNPLFPDDRHA